MNNYSYVFLYYNKKETTVKWFLIIYDYSVTNQIYFYLQILNYLLKLSMPEVTDRITHCL